MNSVAGLDAPVLFERMSVAPAAIAQIADHGQPLGAGSAANVVVFDPRQTWTPATSVSKSRNAPYLGRELVGRVRATVHGGRLTEGAG